MIHKAKRSTQTRGGASGVFRVYRLFYFAGIGGVERGESTGAGAEYRSI